MCAQYNNQTNRSSHSSENESHTFEEVVDFCKQMGFEAEVVGRWVWVTFARKPGREILQELKDFGFRWSARRKKWAHNCGCPSQPGKGSPWDKYKHYHVRPDEEQAPNRKYNQRHERRYA